MTTFGAILNPRDVELAVRETISKWINTYLHEVEDQNEIDRGRVRRPRNYTRINNFTSFNDKLMPTILIVSPGLAERPVKEGGGLYRAKWSVTIGGVVSAQGNAEKARDLSQLYASAIRALITQQNSLEGFAIATEWQDERYQDISSNQSRSVAAFREVFVVEVRDVLNKDGMPKGDPDPEEDSPHGEWPEATEVDVTIEAEEIT